MERYYLKFGLKKKQDYKIVTMTLDEAIDILELTSIIIAVGLGIAGTTTETKGKNGKLTKWGIIALVGIILSNSFSFIQTFIKQKKEKNEQIASLLKERDKDSVAKAHFQAQIDLISINIKKSDISLTQQMQIQGQTKNVLQNIGQSISLEKGIFQQSKSLNVKQQQVLACKWLQF